MNWKSHSHPKTPYEHAVSRVLKFRIWNGFEWLFTQDSFNALKNPKTFRTYEVQQSIALKDKNGKEIYEGDIIHFGYTPNIVFAGIVKYLDDRASYGIISKGGFETFENLIDYMEFAEIIGNVCENPKLVDK